MRIFRTSTARLNICLSGHIQEFDHAAEARRRPGEQRQRPPSRVLKSQVYRVFSRISSKSLPDVMLLRRQGHTVVPATIRVPLHNPKCPYRLLLAPRASRRQHSS